MTSLSVTEESPALRLARYLKEFVGLRTKIVRDVAEFESVLWFGDMPQEQDCLSGAWIEEIDTNAPWLEVKKQQFEKVPAPPEITLPWADEKALRHATPELPPLLLSIFLPDLEADLDEGEELPIAEHQLADHPEIELEYERYRPSWEAWSAEHRRREAIQIVYAELFHLHTQIRKQGEIVEVVLGLGLLDWRPRLNEKILPIRRHAVVTDVALEFDSANGVIRVAAPGEGARLRIEDDMLEAELRPDRSNYAAVEAQLEELGDSIWDKAQMHTALKSWAGALSADSVWSEGLIPISSSENAPAIGFAPALILRKRTQTGMVRIYDDLIDQLSGDSVDVPPGWSGLLDDVEDTAIYTDRDGDDSLDATRLNDPTEIYFPLPANREQRRIVEAIDRQRGVLVQGPPGTGKSHTIANLMCHLLATGKRVLITAETGRALKVLKDMLPEEIRPLCVSLLGQGGDAFAELNTAVQGITTRQASYSPGAYDDRIAEVDSDLDSARRSLATIDSEIRSLREEETCPHSVGHGDYHGTASAIAERVAKEADEFGWLKLPREASSEPPISRDEALGWLEVCRCYTSEQIADGELKIPASSQLPAPAEFAAVVANEAEASSAMAKIKELQAHPAYAAVNALPTDARETLQSDLKRLEEQRLELGRVEGSWLQDALRESVGGRRARWSTLLELSQEQIEKLEPLIVSLGDRVATIPDGLDARKVRADAGAALSYLSDGGKWKRLGMVTPKQLKGRTYLKLDVLVDGEGASSGEALQAVCDHLDLEFAFSTLQAAWNDVGSPLPTGARRMSLAIVKEQATALDSCSRYAQSCQDLAQQMAGATPPIPEPDWLNEEAPRWLEVIEATFAEDRFGALARTVDSCSEALHGLRDLHNAHSLVRTLLHAVDARDIKSYSEGHAGILAVERMRSDQRKRSRIESLLNDAAPGLVERVASSLDDQAWETRLGAWQEAWSWAVADAWLEKRSDFEYQQQLWAQRHTVDREIGRLLGEAASLRAWVHFFERLSARESSALKSWREAVRIMPKDKRSAKRARLLRAARRCMDACRDAIPVWIMPRYLVAEMIDPAPGRYDLVIVDEASQLGIESLFLFYIAKKMVVVGDDQQISPGVGFVKDEAIVGLQQHYLEGIPYHHLLATGSSLYGNAKIRFSQTLVLREHFRCMPEIIQFSNDLCYAPNGTPLDPLRAYPADRLQPLVLRHVSDGYRVGSTQNAQNPPEADAIVAQIAACVADPRYDGASIGVVSLQGDTQAKLIERKLLETLDAAVIEERRLICGDAYAFQGDERNIIFLSMVAAPGEKRIGTLSSEPARQRFNVAVSRAQDQLWLFHTAQLDVLSDVCMRHRLLSYMLDPSRQTAMETDQEFGSNFERLVFRRITDRGFHVRTQVCVGDPTNHRYRIDLVVEGMQGRLAVECDGDEWHGPDRFDSDMARQRDLERAGWQFARIRGGDYYRNPEKAMKPVWAELERQGIQPGGIDETAAEPPAPMTLEVLKSEETEVIEPELIEPPPATVEAEPAVAEVEAAPDQAATPPAVEVTAVQRPNEETQQNTVPQIQPRGSASELFPATPSALTDSDGRVPYKSYAGEPGSDPRQASRAQVAEGLVRIIEAEGPMLAKRAYDIYLRGCGIRRMGGELKRYMNKALHHAIRKDLVVKEDESRKGGLVYGIVRRKGAPVLILRERGPRAFEEIPPSELQLVAKRLEINGGFDPGSDPHLRAILEYFGLKRLTAQVGTTLLEIMDREYSYVDELIERVGE